MYTEYTKAFIVYFLQVSFDVSLFRYPHYEVYRALLTTYHSLLTQVTQRIKTQSVP